MNLVYREFRKDLASGKVGWASALVTMKVALMRSDYQPVVTQRLWSEISMYEIGSVPGEYENVGNTTGKILTGRDIVENTDGSIFLAAANPSWTDTTITSASSAVIVWLDSVEGYKLVCCHTWPLPINGATMSGAGVKFYPITGYPSVGAVIRI